LNNIDAIRAGAGNNTITGTDSNDTIIGGRGNDTLNGGQGDDTFKVAGNTDGYDNVHGGDGTDTIQGSDGDDVIGLNTFGVDNSVETIDGGQGANVIQGSTYADLDFSQTELNNIDAIRAGNGNNTVTGTDANDTIIGGRGNDTLNGGQGDDTFKVAGNTDGYDNVHGGDGVDTIQGSDGDDVIGLNTFNTDNSVETIDGGQGANVIQGSTYADLDFSQTELNNIDEIRAGAGNNAVTGSDTDDTIFSGAGNDTIDGGAGDDTIDGGTGTDTVVFSGNIADYKIVQASNNSFTLHDTIDGRDGTDTVSDVEHFSFADGTLAAEDLPLSASLIDGAVEGVEYQTSSGIHGFTDENGDFTFKSGDDVTFTVGGVTLGTATAEDVAGGQTFLQDIADVDRTDLNDEYTENLATFLQSLDQNGNAYDGIVITDEIRNALTDVQIDLQTASEEEVQQVVEQVGKVYVDEDAAMEHVEDMLVAHTDLDHDAFQDHRADDLNDSLSAGNDHDSAFSSLPDDIGHLSTEHNPDGSAIELGVPSIQFDTPVDMQSGDEAYSGISQDLPTGTGVDSPGDMDPHPETVGADHTSADSGIHDALGMTPADGLLSDELPSAALHSDNAEANPSIPRESSVDGDVTAEAHGSSLDGMASHQPTNETVQNEASVADDPSSLHHSSDIESTHTGSVDAIGGEQHGINPIDGPEMATQQLGSEAGDDISMVGETPSITLADAGDAIDVTVNGDDGNNLDAFDVSAGSGADYSSPNESIDQFMVSDVDPGMDEIPPMDGLDVIPDEGVMPAPEEAGLGVDDAVIPEDIQDPAPVQHEVISA
ncbi:MAG TPA: calcium-binding protein, partial [Desulfobulbus sp.]|nr:calcium-binding protein [Desulfobulbus sp.]